MTYDQLYEHILHYVAQPIDDKRKSCLILGAFMEFMLDCLDEGVKEFVKEEETFSYRKWLKIFFTGG
jgi:hypothetical protein